MIASPSVVSLRKSLALLWIAHLFMDFFTGIWPIYKTLAELDLFYAGLIAGVAGFFGEILQLIFGYFSDRGHAKKILLLGLTFASLIVWVTFVEHLHSLFFLILLVMIGSGSFHPAATGIAGALSRFQKGRVILFFASGGSIGLAISQLAFTSITNFFEGHCYFILIPFSVVFLFILMHKFPSPRNGPMPSSLRSFIEPILKNKRPVVLLYFAQVANFAMMSAFLFLLPDLLRLKECNTWLCMGGGHLCFVLASALIMTPIGYLCDRFGQKIILLLVLIISISLFYSFLVFDQLNTVGTLALLSSLGAFLGIINPIIVSWGHRLIPENPSTISALLMGFAWCFGNLGATCVGYMTQIFQENAIVYAIASMGLAMMLVLFFIFFMPSPQRVLEQEPR